MKELSTKDLQAQIDFIVRKFQDNGMAFEAMKVDFAKAFDGFSLFAKQADVNSLLEKVNESFKAEGESIKSRFRSVDQSLETMRQGFSSINDRHASFDRSIQSLKDAHGVLLEKMQSIINEEKNHVQIREFSDLKASLDAHKQEAIKASQEMQEHKSASKANAANFHAMLADMLVMIQSLKKDIESQSAMQGALAVRFNEIIRSHQQDIASVKEFAKNLVSEQIAAIPKPEKPISLDDAKNAMASKLEPIALDAKSSNLRSVKNESRIMLLEKKIESLYLLLNKSQLEG